jgi:hypothetical protein
VCPLEEPVVEGTPAGVFLVYGAAQTQAALGVFHQSNSAVRSGSIGDAPYFFQGTQDESIGQARLFGRIQSLLLLLKTCRGRLDPVSMFLE